MLGVKVNEDRMVRRLSETLTDVANVASDAEAFCKASGCDESQALRIGLALDEIAANALVHGAEKHISPDVTVEVWADERFLNLTVSANGMLFDPRAPRPEDPDAASAIGGRGLALVLSFADQLSYSRDGRRNVTTFSVLKRARPEED